MVFRALVYLYSMSFRRLNALDCGPYITNQYHISIRHGRPVREKRIFDDIEVVDTRVDLPKGLLSRRQFTVSPIHGASLYYKIIQACTVTRLSTLPLLALPFERWPTVYKSTALLAVSMTTTSSPCQLGHLRGKWRSAG